MRGRNFNALGALSSHASNMITSIKNNSRRKDIEHFKKVDGEYKAQLYFENKSTPEQLKEIRERLRKDNLKALTIKVIVFVILLGLFFYIIW